MQFIALILIFIGCALLWSNAEKKKGSWDFQSLSIVGAGLFLFLFNWLVLGN